LTASNSQSKKEMIEIRKKWAHLDQVLMLFSPNKQAQTTKDTMEIF